MSKKDIELLERRAAMVQDILVENVKLRADLTRERELRGLADEATVNLVRELKVERERAEKAEAELRAHLESGWDGEERYNQAVFRAEAAETERDGWHTCTFALAAEVAELRRELRERDYYG